MSNVAFAAAAVVSPESSEAGSIRGGEKIGPVKVLLCRDRCVELKTPTELSWGGALIGLVPIVWCAAAWTICLHEHLLHQRLGGCLALSAIALVSAVLMNSCLAVVWRFDGKRLRITRRVGLLGRGHNARRLAGLKVESTRASTLADVQLRMTLVDATGQEQFEIAKWKRREIDRAQVDGLAAAIRGAMNWVDEE
jgi:hypothetical protein